MSWPAATPEDLGSKCYNMIDGIIHIEPPAISLVFGIRAAAEFHIPPNDMLHAIAPPQVTADGQILRQVLKGEKWMAYYPALSWKCRFSTFLIALGSGRCHR